MVNIENEYDVDNYDRVIEYNTIPSSYKQIHKNRKYIRQKIVMLNFEDKYEHFYRDDEYNTDPRHILKYI